jgi:hypothetical protein
MTLKRRLDAVETSLSPTQLVLRWLAEAHALGDIESYVASLLPHDPPVPPPDRLAREAVHGVRTAMRGKRPEVVAAAVRSALRETVFRFELVMRINVATHELLDREGLIDAALSAQVALAACGQDRDPKSAERLVKLRDLVLYRAGELSAAQEARTLVERRYLDGNAALFPQVAAPWVQQVRSTQSIVDMAERFAAFEGAPAIHPPGPELSSRRTAELVADLVEPAKAEALDKLGEGRQSLNIAASWVRSKLTPRAGRRRPRHPIPLVAGVSQLADLRGCPDNAGPGLGYDALRDPRRHEGSRPPGCHGVHRTRRVRRALWRGCRVGLPGRPFIRPILCSAVPPPCVGGPADGLPHQAHLARRVCSWQLGRLTPRPSTTRYSLMVRLEHLRRLGLRRSLWNDGRHRQGPLPTGEALGEARWPDGGQLQECWQPKPSSAALRAIASCRSWPRRSNVS